MPDMLWAAPPSILILFHSPPRPHVETPAFSHVHCCGLCRAGGRSTPTLTPLLVNQPADPAASDRLLLELEGALALADTTDTSVVNVNQCFLASAGMLPHRRMRGCRTAAQLPDSGGQMGEITEDMSDITATC